MSGQPVDGEVTTASALIWVSISELARIKGKSKQAISKRVKRLVDGKVLETRREGSEILVNRVAFDRAVGDHTDPAQALRNPGLDIGGPGEEPSQPAPAAPPAANEDSGGAPKPKGYLAHKETSAAYQAENDRLDLEERLGKTCDLADVEERTFNVFRRLRDRLLSLPSISAPRVANASDERAARAILDEEVRKLLDGLAADLDKPEDDDGDEVSEEPALDDAARNQ